MFYSVLLLLTLPAAAQAQFNYTTNAGGTNLTITGYTGPGGAVTIPGTINALPVTSIGDRAFLYQQGVNSVTISDGITNIGNYAFDSCTLTSITIPDSVTRIGNNAFSVCGLTNVIIPEHVASIGSLAFDYCYSLNAVYFLGNAPTADSSVFSYDTNATAYYLPGTTGWGPTFGGLPTALLIQFNYTTNAGGTNLTITGYTGPGGAVTIPGSINGLPVTSIGADTFLQCFSLTSVTIPNGVMNLEYSAFNDCTNLTNVLIPNSVTNIGETAFAGCQSLTSLVIPNGVTSIGAATFAACASLTNVWIPSNVTSVGAGAFMECSHLITIAVDANNPAYSSLDGILFDKNQTALIQFPGGKTGNYTVPNGIADISFNAFAGCGLTSITIPSGVTNIEDGAFAVSHVLSAVYFEGNAPTIGGSLFFGDNVTTYYLPGTTRWGAFVGHPTIAIWNPQMQTGDSSFGMQTNRFGFNITGTSNLVVVVETCTNLTNPVWTPLQTNTLTSGSVYFSDSQSTNFPVRFYRLNMP